ncbi:Meckel syndrome type 1 protein like protein [Habropoda laboriosa]|uniref:Meckel syndrome type 1 protein like protein n=1 Tax=Habropoda laboriosa TaxID=597456 RepID=A0A0L7R4K9_9HYME|nr:PREDICTED: Meckel syndrome type 1 protein homolog [Habropoda laboriosa]KOC65817.1 Meckel syndrome type 1 protein like protein [Habropoda laboriosa]
MSNKIRKTKITANYKVKEPINNFKIRVKIVQQRSLLVELLENEGDTRDSNFLEEEDRTFNWQEKVFSPFELSFYSEEKNCLSECQKEYYRQIKEKDIQGSQLYTYTQNDLYYAEKELLTKPYTTKLMIRNQAALPALQNRKPFLERYNKTVVDDAPSETRIRANHYLYMDSSVMYVMVDLSQRDKALASSDKDVETVLCVIIYDKSHKILSVNPDFTNDRYYTITNSSGIQFNYWIEHVSEKQSSLELQQQQNESRRKIKEHLMYKGAEICHGLQLLSPNVHKFFIKLDILSAHDFFFDGLCISYHIDLPEQWSTNQTDRLFGRTQRCNLKNNSAYFSYATEIVLNFQSTYMTDQNYVSSSWPRLLLTVTSLDSWFRYRTEGYTAMPLPVLPGSYRFKLPTWRPTGSIINSLRRFFTGGTYELEDITYCSIPKGYEDKMLNKSQLMVTSSGYIKLNINIIHKTHSSIKDSDQIDYFQRLSTNKLMTNVENVFEQFKAARERMLQIRNLNI